VLIQVVAITGASGLIGSALCAALGRQGQRVVRLVRRPPTGPSEVHWSPDQGIVHPENLEGVDAIVHLAGENIAAGRWTRRRMERIWESRVRGTQALVESLQRLSRRPAVLLAASAVGIYGDRGPELLDESSPPGQGFLPELCKHWEQAAAGVGRWGMRCVHARMGVVLSPVGGMLARVLRPFRLGLGGPIGSGRQYLSWVGLDDAIGAICHLLADDQVSGPVNVVAPEPVTNREFTRALAEALGRPAALRVPAWLLRLVFGQLADEVLLSSARVQPRVLLQRGYCFRHPGLAAALCHLLGE